MGFQILAQRPGSRRAEPCLVSIVGQKARYLRLSFSAAGATQLGWGTGKPYEVAIGDGPDLGWVRIKPAGKGGYILRVSSKLGTRLNITLPLPLGWPRHLKQAEPERLTPRSGGELLLKMPFLPPFVEPSA